MQAEPVFSSSEEGNVLQERVAKPKDRLFSRLAVRLFFLVLLGADALWWAYASVSSILSTLLLLLTFGKVELFVQWKKKSVLSLKRASVSGLALFTALFSPAFGIMIACTYFLTYDKEGLEEVVPESIRAQFVPQQG